jgi:hypothetical protein
MLPIPRLAKFTTDNKSHFQLKRLYDDSSNKKISNKKILNEKISKIAKPQKSWTKISQNAKNLEIL